MIRPFLYFHHSDFRCTDEDGTKHRVVAQYVANLDDDFCYANTSGAFNGGEGGRRSPPSFILFSLFFLKSFTAKNVII